MSKLLDKLAYFQGGGGVNEPTPGEKKYKSDPAIVVQPRFKEPFYRNYDLYTIPGMEDVGPGTGYHGLQNYKSVAEFLEARRKRPQPRYKADDSWIQDNGDRTKSPNIQARAGLLNRIIKIAADENDGPNFDYGHGAYDAMNRGEKMKSITDFKRTSPGALMDSNDIDFPIDDQVNRQDQMIYPEEDEYQIRRMKGDKYQFPSDGSPLDPGELNISLTTPQIAGEHSYLPDPDFEGKSDNGSQLDFGRDYTEENLLGRPSADGDSMSDMAHGDDKEMNLDELEAKYLESSETGLFGLPDGVDPEGHDADQTEQIENPFTGTSDIGTQPYEDKWNI